MKVREVTGKGWIDTYLSRYGYIGEVTRVQLTIQTTKEELGTGLSKFEPEHGLDGLLLRDEALEERRRVVLGDGLCLHRSARETQNDASKSTLAN